MLDIQQEILQILKMLSSKQKAISQKVKELIITIQLILDTDIIAPKRIFNGQCFGK